MSDLVVRSTTGTVTGLDNVDTDQNGTLTEAEVKTALDNAGISADYVSLSSDLDFASDLTDGSIENVATLADDEGLTHTASIKVTDVGDYLSSDKFSDKTELAKELVAQGSMTTEEYDAAIAAKVAGSTLGELQTEYLDTISDFEDLDAYVTFLQGEDDLNGTSLVSDDIVAYRVERFESEKLPEIANALENIDDLMEIMQSLVLQQGCAFSDNDVITRLVNLIGDNAELTAIMNQGGDVAEDSFEISQVEAIIEYVEENMSELLYYSGVSEFSSCIPEGSDESWTTGLSDLFNEVYSDDGNSDTLIASTSGAGGNSTMGLLSRFQDKNIADRAVGDMILTLLNTMIRQEFANFGMNEEE